MNIHDCWKHGERHNATARKRGCPLCKMEANYAPNIAVVMVFFAAVGLTILLTRVIGDRVDGLEARIAVLEAAQSEAEQ